jgi:hypothetical protein
MSSAPPYVSPCVLGGFSRTRAQCPRFCRAFLRHGHKVKGPLDPGASCPQQHSTSRNSAAQCRREQTSPLISTRSNTKQKTPRKPPGESGSGNEHTRVSLCQAEGLPLPTPGPARWCAAREKLEDQDSRPSKDAQGPWWGDKHQMRLSDMFALAKAFRDLE